MTWSLLNDDRNINQQLFFILYELRLVHPNEVVQWKQTLNVLSSCIANIGEQM